MDDRFTDEADISREEREIIGVVEDEVGRLLVMIDVLRTGLAQPGIRQVVNTIKSIEDVMLADLAAASGSVAAAVVAARRPLSTPHAIDAVSVRLLEGAAEINESLKETDTPWGTMIHRTIAAAKGQSEIAEYLHVVSAEPRLDVQEPAISSGHSLWQTHAAFALARASGHYRHLSAHLAVAGRWEGCAMEHSDETFAEDWRVHAFSRAQAAHRSLARGIAHITAFIADRGAWRPFVLAEDAPDVRRWHIAVRDMGRAVRVPVLMGGARVARLTGSEPMMWFKEIKRGREAAYSQSLFEALNRSPCYRACIRAQRLLERQHQPKSELETV